MFYKVALDVSEKNGPPNRRFLSCVRFVADEVVPAVFYLNAEWSKHEAVRALGWDAGNLNSIQKHVLKERDLLPLDLKSLEAPTLVYLLQGSWENQPDAESGAKSGLVIPNREFVLSTAEIVNRAHLRDNGLNAQTAILCLAAVGLDIMLPNVSFNLVADEEIERIKEKLKEERYDYLEVAASLAKESYERLKDGDHTDAFRWAENEVAFKIAPKARILEEATSALTGRQLRRAGYSFWKDGVPAIGSAYFGGGLLAAGAASTEAAVRSIVDTIGASRTERRIPELAYAIKLHKALKNNT